MGVHTGDSMTVAPALTLTDKEYQALRVLVAVLREIADTGGSNVQFAVCPKTGRILVIEMNPRVSRSSALAFSYRLSHCRCRQIGSGLSLDEFNDITNSTPASFEPTIDYVVTKYRDLLLEKFSGADAILSTSMKSVGEAGCWKVIRRESTKALRSMEIGLTGLNPVDTIADCQVSTSFGAGSAVGAKPDLAYCKRASARHVN